jgi:hypothetical protein
MMDRGRTSVVQYLLPSVKNVFWVALFFGVIAFGPSMMNIDGDLGRHITIGSYILSSRSIPTVDLFSHTMSGAPLTPHEWLAQTAFALAYQWMGLDGIVLLTALVIASSFGLVLRMAIRRSGSLLIGLLFTLVAAGAASLHWLTRPHIFTFFLLAIWLTILDQIQQGKPWRWMWLPVAMLFWVNLHGAFIAGFVVWFLVLAGWAWEKWVEGEVGSDGRGYARDMLRGGAASLVVTVINPSGYHLWQTSLGYLGSRYLVGHTAEYLSPDFHNSSTWLFLIMILLLVGFLGMAKKRAAAGDIMLAGAWLVMGLYSARNIPLFAMIAAPVLAASASDIIWQHAARIRVLDKLQNLDQRLAATEALLKGWLWPVVGILAAVLILSGGGKLDYRQQGNHFDPKVFPVQAVDWLNSHPQQGEMLNYFPWGGYLLYRDWPKAKVFIDGQTDFYGEALTREYEKVLSLEDGWRAVLLKYNVSWVIWPADSRLAQELAQDSSWRVVYQDETTAIIVRR